MAPLDGADRDRAAFDVPRPVEFRTAAQQAHLVIVLVETDPAIQILFERQVLYKRVAWEVAHDPIMKEVGNNPIHGMAYNRKKHRWFVENSSYLAGAELCHPSDNLGAVLAAAEHAGGSGKDFLTALAVAYQVEAALTAAASFMAHGFDLTTQLAFSLGAGVSKALGLDEAKMAAAVEICG